MRKEEKEVIQQNKREEEALEALRSEIVSSHTQVVSEFCAQCLLTQKNMPEGTILITPLLAAE